MTPLFKIRDYRHLFTAQVVALFGTGMTTVALGLLAYDLAGARAAAVLGTALTIKMVAYVLIAPLATAYVDRMPRRLTLVSLDILRASVVLALPWVDQAWQIYVLIAILQAASAAFTPTFQAVIPDIVPDESQYTRALSASQLASTMESLLSPVLAAVALAVMSYHWLFGFTVIGFAFSAALVVSTSIPDAARSARTGVFDRTFAGIRVFAATPRLRGVLGLDLAVAGAGAIAMVSTVNIVRDHLGGSQAGVAWLLAASGIGTMIVAMMLPRVLDRVPERPVMLGGGGILVAAAASAAVIAWAPGALTWTSALAVWSAIGVGMSLVLTPVGQVLRRSSAPADRASVFAAQFSLSHLCWLITYPIAGWLGTSVGFGPTFAVLGGLSLIGLAAAVRAWPRRDPAELEHHHLAGEVAPGHLAGAVPVSAGVYRHRHPFVIDTEHVRWPS
ncbi:MFS transporter [Tsukamurella ocularis]|uniref:MFS transporter n=1 Tax=Tsukamurella ocularis TaxID=1970234 RepID=UPI002169735F|nr:MFS transporter [Tsukamurella ocularis]MCS3780858.1 MFS family permease [Tsukamurella ocularis]MCS3786682.1 MFS family permease [Tsukamurella ocularis]MCS3850524.1 MFS family permease [Tsukamurella ocularis]